MRACAAFISGLGWFGSTAGLRQGVGLLGAGRALGVHQHDVHHVVGLVHPPERHQLEAEPGDEERVASDRRDDGHLHGGDQPEAFEQEIGEGDEGVGGRLPQLHRQVLRGAREACHDLELYGHFPA
jgi:hypothetical protein